MTGRGTESLTDDADFQVPRAAENRGSDRSVVAIFRMDSFIFFSFFLFLFFFRHTFRLFDTAVSLPRSTFVLFFLFLFFSRCLKYFAITGVLSSKRDSELVSLRLWSLTKRKG